jgi:hypothetical protein
MTFAIVQLYQIHRTGKAPNTTGFTMRCFFKFCFGGVFFDFFFKGFGFLALFLGIALLFMMLYTFVAVPH